MFIIQLSSEKMPKFDFFSFDILLIFEINSRFYLSIFSHPPDISFLLVMFSCTIPVTSLTLTIYDGGPHSKSLLLGLLILLFIISIDPHMYTGFCAFKMSSG